RDAPAPTRLGRVRALERGARSRPDGDCRLRRLARRRGPARGPVPDGALGAGAGRGRRRRRAAPPRRFPRPSSPLASSRRSRPTRSGPHRPGTSASPWRTVMRACALVLALVSVILVSAPAAAQEAEALRRELEALQKQLQSVTDRLQKLETQRTPAPVPAPAPAPPPPGAAAPGTSVTDLARPRQPFTLYQQRGAGQLLFDMGVTGDFVGNLTQSNVEKAGGGTFGGQENRFFPREVELSLFGQIDPYASAEVRIEAGEDARGPDTGVSLAEASVAMLTLPLRTQAKFRQLPNRFGYSHVIHEHDLPWIHRPNVLRRFLGDEGLKEKGLELTIVPDLPFYLEGLAGVFNGDNEAAFGRSTLRVPMFTGRLRTFLELGDASAFQLGMSVASGETSEKR